MSTTTAQIVRISKALSDPTRVRILREIAKTGSISCGDAVRFAGLSQPTVSHHIKVLTDAGLLKTTKSGRHVTVTVDCKALAAFAGALAGIAGN